MPSARKAAGEERTFTEEARRKQIIAAAIDTIAESGYGNASLAAIAERARTSKSVISYHFSGGKDELINEVIKYVYTLGGEFMVPRMQAATNAREALRLYITTNLDFLATHPNEVRTIVEIFSNYRPKDFAPSGVTAMQTSMREDIRELDRQLLQEGQRIGEFRDFDTRVMAVSIRGAIDLVPPLLFEDPTMDVKHYAEEIATLFDLATRKETTR
jgi:AcrR family transcriptional regulator